MNLQVDVSVTLVLPAPTPGLLQVEIPAMDGVQSVSESVLTLDPNADSETFSDFYGNPCRRLRLPGGDVQLTYSARVAIPDGRAPLLAPVEADALHLPTGTLLYTLPSRFCQSDKLAAMARDMFGDASPGFGRVQSICQWVNAHIEYRCGASDSMTSAYDTAAQRVGVCRDFAHLGIAFCRALGIPARYVSGYCLGLNPPDFHAYFQAFLDGRWVSFDATELQPRPALVQIAVGRDAADCAWSTFYGPGDVKDMMVNVTETQEKKTEEAGQ